MALTIWKYSMRPVHWYFSMPKGAKFLSAEEQNGNIVVYALVDPSAQQESRSVVAIPTGSNIPDYFQAEFIGTVKMEGGRLMFHVFVSQ